MTTRVIQWATDAVGSAQLQQVIDSPDLELAGLFVYSPDKVGRDIVALLDSGKDVITTTSYNHLSRQGRTRRGSPALSP